MRTPDDNLNRPGTGNAVRRPLQGEVVERGGQAGPPPAGPKQFPGMGELLQGFRHCWLRAITFGVLAAAAVGAGAWFGVPLVTKVRARMLLYVAPEQPHFVFNNGEGPGAALSFKKTQQALVKSRMVLYAALRDPKVANTRTLRRQTDAVEWLEQQLVVDYSTGPDILTIALSGDDDEELKAIVKAVSQAYLEEIVYKEHNKRREQGDELKALKRRYEELLRDKRRTLQGVMDAATKGDAGEPARQQERAKAALDAAEKELGQVRSDILRLKAEGAAEADGAVPESILNQQVDKDPRVQECLQAVTQLEEELEQIRRNVAPNRFPALSAKARKQLEGARDDLQARRDKVRPVIEGQLRAQMKAKADEQKGRLAMLQRLEKLLDAEADRLRDQGPGGPAAKRPADLVAALQDEVEQLEGVLKSIATQLEVMNVEHDAPARVRPLEEEPVVSHPDVRKRQLMGTVGGGLGALAFVVFGLSWWECRAQRINSPDEVVRGAGLKLMGTLPLLPARARRNADSDWQHLLLESVDSMRTMLLHVARSESLRVLMVTSAVGGEGKTSLSSHLATSLARAGRKTLLIDGDFRKPSLHQVFSLPEGAGLCELLRGELELSDAVQTTAVDGLSLMAAGACDPVALGELAHRGLASMLAPLRQQFDFIIIDSAPVLPVTDSLLVGQEVDGVLFSILRDVSRMGRVCAAYERLASLGVRILGAVITGAGQAELYGREYRYLARGVALRTAASESASETGPDDGPASEEE
jgi:capsular exopolysaccharide synthesis family protein